MKELWEIYIDAEKAAIAGNKDELLSHLRDIGTYSFLCEHIQHRFLSALEGAFKLGVHNDLSSSEKTDLINAAFPAPSSSSLGGLIVALSYFLESEDDECKRKEVHLLIETEIGEKHAEGDVFRVLLFNPVFSNKEDI